MKELIVYADFDWLNAPEEMGRLTFEMLRGNVSYGFEFAPSWLKQHSDITLSDDLQNYTGLQYTKPDRDIFACFMDALPDRWGQLLLNRREQTQARMESRPVRTLNSFDFLMGIDDFSRMGAFRFKEQRESDFINASLTLRTPPITSLAMLQQAADAIEKAEEKHQLPEQKWLTQLLKPGTSLGGARPKASVIDENNQLCIAKFPSRKDDYDVELWEHCCCLLAKQAGIQVAQTKVVSLTGPYHTLLSRRFDRTSEGKRIQFASALTLLGLQDGDNASNNYGYLNIVDFIIRSCTNVEQNLRELYRRVAFNICVGNTDDHFRNHGFILTRKGWTLAPAYDINPTHNTYQSLLISAHSDESNLQILLDAAEDYMLSKGAAQQIINEVIAAVKNWRKIATHLGIAKHEIENFAHVFERFTNGYIG